MERARQRQMQMQQIANDQATRNKSKPDHREFLLGSMRCASLSLRSWAAEIDYIGVALRGNVISTEVACEWLNDLGLLRYLPEGVPA